MRKYSEPIEHLEGHGQLIRGDMPPLEMSYVLTIYQEFHEPGPGKPRLPGLKDLAGSIFGLDEGQCWDLQNQDLMLVLEGGRRMLVNIEIDGTIISGRELV